MAERQTRIHSTLRGLHVLASCACGLGATLFLGCGEDETERNVLGRLDARLEALHADERAMRAALSPLPEITGPCEVPNDVVGPAVFGAGADIPSARVEAFTEGTSDLRDRADTITAAGADRWLGRFDGDDWQRYELAIAATAFEAPTLGQSSYEPGSVEGRAVLWDHLEDRVVCVRDVRVVPTGDRPLSVAAGTGEDALSTRSGSLRVLEHRLAQAALAQSLDAMRREPAAHPTNPPADIAEDPGASADAP